MAVIGLIKKTLGIVLVHIHIVELYFYKILGISGDYGSLHELSSVHLHMPVLVSPLKHSLDGTIFINHRQGNQCNIECMWMVTEELCILWTEEAGVFF